VLDENEEMENHYEELAAEYHKNEGIIEEQRAVILRIEQEREELKGELERRNAALIEKE
jgi:hypothetical protein